MQAEHALLLEDVGEKPNNDREVFAFVICREDNRVLVGVWSSELALHVEGYAAFEGVHHKDLEIIPAYDGICDVSTRIVM